MQEKTKGIIRKSIRVAALFAMIICIVWINALKLQDDNFSNYEKVTDTGVRDYYKDPITPVIAVLFYRDENQQPGFKPYFKKQKNEDASADDMKMAVVPKNVSKFNRPVIEKLYDEIPSQNKINKIVIIHTESQNAKDHKKLIKKRFPDAQFTEILVDNKNKIQEQDINLYLQEKDTFVVFLANLDRGLNTEKSERLANAAVFFAQKNNYQMNVFDIVDEYIASALETGGAELSYVINRQSSLDLLSAQKKNLERYILNNKAELLHYFAYNIEWSSQGKEVKIPQRNSKNYRLFDRGIVYVKAYDKNFSLVFEELKLNQEDGIIFVISKIAKDIMNSNQSDLAKYYRIYLLTDMEQVHGESGKLLANYIEPDDGVYISYKKQAALLLASDKPADYDLMIQKLRTKAKIKENVPNKKISFYRFKYVEMEYEN